MVALETTIKGLEKEPIERALTSNFARLAKLARAKLEEEILRVNWGFPAEEILETIEVKAKKAGLSIKFDAKAVAVRRGIAALKEVTKEMEDIQKSILDNIDAVVAGKAIPVPSQDGYYYMRKFKAEDLRSFLGDSTSLKEKEIYETMEKWTEPQIEKIVEQSFSSPD